jgi:hypothetical protein
MKTFEDFVRSDENPVLSELTNGFDKLLAAYTAATNAHRRAASARNDLGTLKDSMRAHKEFEARARAKRLYVATLQVYATQKPLYDAYLEMLETVRKAAEAPPSVRNKWHLWQQQVLDLNVTVCVELLSSSLTTMYDQWVDITCLGVSMSEHEEFRQAIFDEKKLAEEARHWLDSTPSMPEWSEKSLPQTMLNAWRAGLHPFHA